ncbi:MAG: RNA polymerase sigma factor [Bacteroidales bacterium]|nr:RNA polymerase sigma factor [Bacteroidales bacterium]
MSEIDELVKRCQRKSNAAFDELYHKYSPMVYGLCLRYTKNSDDAQDLLQECFIKLIGKIGEFQFKGSFDGWLRKLVIHEALNFLRVSKADFDDNLDELPIIDERFPDSISNMSANELLTYINALPKGYRSIFNLYVIEGYQHSEIAELLNISESSSRSQLLRARMALIEMIKKDCKDE